MLSFLRKLRVSKQLFRDLFAVTSRIGSYHCRSLNNVYWHSTFVFKPDVIHYREHSLHRCISVSACQNKFSKEQEILECMVFFLNYLQFSPIFQWAFCTQNPMTERREETSIWRQTFISECRKAPLFKNRIKMNLPSLWFWDYVLHAIKKMEEFGLRRNSDLNTSDLVNKCCRDVFSIGGEKYTFEE